jgi:hypothetical protein
MNPAPPVMSNVPNSTLQPLRESNRPCIVCHESITRSFMERVTKIVVLGWSLTALAIDLWLLRGAWPALPITASLGFAAMAALSIVDRRAIGIVLALAYVFPVLVYLHVGHYYPLYSDAWMVLLLGAILPQSVRTSWHVPSPWRAALVGWALVTVAGATIVALREIDFLPSLFNVTTVTVTGGAGPPFVIRWVLHVALVTTIGILWFDWLVGAGDLDFRRFIAWPMACSAAVLALVAVYQLFIDVTFLNPTVYGNLRRASGTVFDANVGGTLAALWMGGAVLIATQDRTTAPLATAVVMLAGWLAVWATGSRTAFAAAAIVTIFSVVGLVAAERRSRPDVEGRARSGRSTALFKVVIATLLAAGSFIVLANADIRVVSPLARFADTLPEMSAASIRAFLWEQLWNRNGYGGASTAMIARYPWVGVGVGSFQSFLPEFVAESGGVIPPDNAQNWYRHQLAELGLIGSLPWMVWVGSFAWYTLHNRAHPLAQRWTARGVLVAFAAISFLGMPGQEPMVAMTFWVMAFWFIRLTGVPDPRPRPVWAFVGIALVLAIFSAGTILAGMNDLRVPMRAQRVGWQYSYGFLRPDAFGFGAGPGWTGKRAVAVFDAQSDWLVLTLSADYRAVPGSPFTGSAPPARTRPTGVTVWCNGKKVLSAQLETTVPAVHYLRVPSGNRWVLLESRVDRTVPLKQLGVNDSREIGVQMQWHGVPKPAPEASILECGAP